ncbi:phosphopantetheine-binding protein [Actinokineospora inagensis]|uniref:phosphopantetheine-binding protein n=1 Tax=Actinokineospora inagensis TaxID=103730 RepID=UPI0004045C3A|nr:phosphopantetheine-binding protein [Actinokineospora inagensis]
MTADEFVDLVRDELGLDISAEHLDRGFDQVPGWNSINSLRLLALLERAVGKPLSVPDLLSAPTLGSVYALAAGG